ncbi:MAG: endonuclease/exonuclease/phosphatase family protein [Bacteriovoracaceae bacterium]|nr:endonuclease/exonuclease/phosphatase family protein [Bacteriovoracaceae bacterium]
MSLKLISSNIRFDCPEDGDHRWDHRKQVLASVINGFGADLLGTQEGRSAQIKDLETLLVDMELIDLHRQWIAQRMYPSIFVNPGTIDVEISGDIWLSKTPDVPGSLSFGSAFPRLCTWIIGSYKKSGLKFIYVNTHLDHLQESTRAQQIQVLIEATNEINKDSLPVILSGDFNSSVNDQVRQQIASLMPNLYDPWLALNIPEETSYHKFKGHHPKGQRIDWVLLDQSIICNQISLDKFQQNGIFPSDHFPLKAKLLV